MDTLDEYAEQQSAEGLLHSVNEMTAWKFLAIAMTGGAVINLTIVGLLLLHDGLLAVGFLKSFIWQMIVAGLAWRLSVVDKD